MIPFSSLPGTRVLLPGSSLRATIFPARIEIDDIASVKPVSVGTWDLPVEGPVSNFTVQLDLERSHVLVWGDAKGGFFRYRLTGGPLTLKWEKGEESIAVSGARGLQAERPARIEKLSLGSHKKLDWQLVTRRFAMEEIFPIWFQMAQLIPRQEPAVYEGAASLLPRCCDAILAGDRNQLLEPFENVLRAGFEGILSPRLIDTDYNGFDLRPLAKESSANPLAMAVDGALLIRSLFIQNLDGVFHILPALPVPFHSGRMTNLACGDLGYLDMEWTKKTIRRMVFLAREDGEVKFAFQKGLKRFRLHSESKSRAVVLKTGDAITVKKGQTYILDRFEK